MIRDPRLKCVSCGAVVRLSEQLTAPSPFDPLDILRACPQCRQCTDGFDQLCDAPGCDGVVSGGYPVEGGYRQTCGRHWGQT